MNQYELTLLNGIQTYVANDWLNGFFAGLTWVLNYELFWIATILVLLIFPKTRWMGVAALFAFALESVITQLIIKEIIMRPRPFMVNTDYVLIVAPPGGYSFPSGHTGAAFALASAMYFAGRSQKSRIWIFYGIFAVIVGFSRMYVYVHYPTDVLAGIAFGIFFGWLGSWLAARLHRYWDRRNEGDAVSKSNELRP